jgi:glycosyltransferase involved in cell wall biosynthesis
MNLVRGGMGGSETYARALTRELAARPGLDVVASVPRSAAGFSAGVTEEVVTHVAGGGSSARRVLTQLQASFLAPGLRAHLATADVVHYPLTVAAPPPPRGTPYVVTLHDVQHHDLRELFGRAELAYRAVAYDRPARRADAVITISEFSKRQIVRHLGVPAERVHVVPLGVEAEAFTPSSAEPEPFVLYPAREWPHKNHATLLEAMHLVRRTRPELRLVLTGGTLEALGDLPSWVERRGLVSREELLRLYRHAACLAFPSRYEGFGLPPLEAMASGCPVAAARAGSLPEVCGDAAVLFDPDDPADVARAIDEAVERRADLAGRGLARARGHTWSACAAGTERVYRQVARA